MNKLSAGFTAAWKRFREGNVRKQQREALMTLFDEMYVNRRRVFYLNFVRGIFFGLGSVLGGTLVLAILVWVLSWFIDFPLIGDTVKQLIDTVPSR